MAIVFGDRLILVMPMQLEDEAPYFMPVATSESPSSVRGLRHKVEAFANNWSTLFSLVYLSIIVACFIGTRMLR